MYNNVFVLAENMLETLNSLIFEAAFNIIEIVIS